MVRIREIKESEYPALLYDSYNELVGEIMTEAQLEDIRLQIAEKQAKGYYIKYGKEIINISDDGLLDHWPPNFFEHCSNCLIRIFNLMHKRGHEYK